MYEPTNRDSVAIDIETTGLEARQSISVAGLLPPDRHASVILNTEGRTANETEIVGVVEDMSRHRLEVQVVHSEESLIDQLSQLVFERFDREFNKLVAYNAETWKSGFDFPFIRTTCAQTDQDMPLKGLYFLDLLEVISKRFNTLIAEKGEDGEEPEEKNDLVGAHRVLCNPSHEFDPFEDSAKAVSCHYNGQWAKLVQHNVSDLHRTLDLAKVAHRLASPRHLKPYRL